MNTRFFSRFFLGILVITSLACSLTNVSSKNLETGPVQTFTLNEPYPTIDAVQDVTLSMGFGELNLSGGADALIDGEVRYNIKEWEPAIVNKDNSLTISQGDRDILVNGSPGEDVVNIWDVRLGQIPLNLTLTAGVYDATLDLSGLPIHSLVVQDGASNSTIRFDTLNPVEMESLSYQTGVSQIKFIGLANANFSQMEFHGGIGDYTFDFSGDMQQAATVNIDAGASSVRIIVPEGSLAQVVPGDKTKNISAFGAWDLDGSKYVNQGEGPRLTIILNVSVGELHLANQ